MGAVRVGLIGTGPRASVQAAGFACVNGADLVAVSGVPLDRAQGLAAEHRIPHVFDDYREMLRSIEIDLVSVATAPDLHHEMAMAALEASAHVLCAAPFATNARQAVEMLDAAERLGRTHALDGQSRFTPTRAAMKRLLDSGKIGNPRFVHVVSFSSGLLSRADGAPAHRALCALTSEHVDAIRWWLGPFASIRAQLRVPGAVLPGEDSPGREPVAAAAVTFGLENGVAGRLDVGIAPRGGRRRTELGGPRGTLILDGAGLYRASPPLWSLAEVVPDGRDRGRLDDPRLGAFVELAQRVVDRINAVDFKPFPTFADGLAVQRVMEAIRQQEDAPPPSV